MISWQSRDPEGSVRTVRLRWALGASALKPYRLMGDTVLGRKVHRQLDARSRREEASGISPAVLACESAKAPAKPLAIAAAKRALAEKHIVGS